MEEQTSTKKPRATRARKPRTKRANVVTDNLQALGDNPDAESEIRNEPDILPMLKAQNETLQSFTSQQASTLQQISESLKLLTGQGQDAECTSNGPDNIIDEIMREQECSDNDETSPSDDNIGLSDEVKELLAQLDGPNETGIPFSETTAKAFSSALRAVNQKDTMEKLKSSYKTPANCPLIVVPSVNPEIWTGLPLRAKTADAKNQALQQHLVRAMIAQGHLMDKVIKSVPNNIMPHVLKPILDSIQSLAIAVQEINMRRKLSLKPHLKPEYFSLCSSRIPVTAFLFGDDLEQSLKLVRATSNIVRKEDYRFKPYDRTRQFRKPNNNLNYQRPPPFQFQRGGQRGLRQFHHQPRRWQNPNSSQNPNFQRTQQ